LSSGEHRQHRQLGGEEVVGQGRRKAAAVECGVAGKTKLERYRRRRRPLVVPTANRRFWIWQRTVPVRTCMATTPIAGRSCTMSTHSSHRPLVTRVTSYSQDDCHFMRMPLTARHRGGCGHVRRFGQASARMPWLCRLFLSRHGLLPKTPRTVYQ